MDEPFLVAVDGDNVLTRLSYGYLQSKRHLSKSGANVGGVWGAVLEHIKLVNSVNPTHMVWCFDSGSSTYRTGLLGKYKIHRTPRDRIILEQFKHFREFLGLAGVAQVSEDGVEADDLIAKAVLTADIPAMIVSADHDLRQLVSSEPRRVVYQHTSAPLPVIWDESMIADRYSVTPEALPGLWAMMGDKGDNIAGIPGIGEKGAILRMRKYGTFEACQKFDKKCLKFSDRVDRNYKLIKLDGSLAKSDLSLDKIKFSKDAVDSEGMYEFFERMRFNALLSKIKPVGLY